MARHLSLVAPSALVFALVACGATDPGLFSGSGPGATAGATNQAGAPATAGDGSIATDPGGDSSVGGDTTGGRDTGGGSAVGGSGAAPGGSGGAAAHGGAGGSAGVGGAQAGAGGTSAGAGGTSAGAGGTSAGAAGSGGAEPTCNELLAEATTELAAARACNIARNVTQCTGKVKTTCNCEVPVENQDSPETQAYEATLKQINEQKCVQVCPAIACVAANHAQCLVSGAYTNLGAYGTAGTCVAGYGLTPF
ncbi:MAG: hypothetical protein ABJB12_19760 [Pseudomonadota bacterium]